MYPNCQKIIAFKLFDNGKRPAEICNTLSLKKQTVFRYFQEWKKRRRIIEQAAEQNKIRQCVREWIHSCEMDINYYRRYSTAGQQGKTGQISEMETPWGATAERPLVGYR